MFFLCFVQLEQASVTIDTIARNRNWKQECLRYSSRLQVRYIIGRWCC